MTATTGEGESRTSEPASSGPTRAIVLVPVLRTTRAARARERTPEARLEEAVGLAAAINLDVSDEATVPLAELRPATLFGKGKVEEIAARVEAGKIGLAVIDHALSPVQQRNLEKAWKTKVIDRTGLILEIFGERAHTREGSLQVELAHLEYQKGRLVRSWTHLERQRGGFGFLGGPGETQIEADRRALEERIDRIKQELKTVVTRRRLQRDNRRRSAQPTVALVGYTNAGKSTLFNRLTSAEVLADNKLFATLDPTLRRVTLPEGTEIILSDTVGFVSDLPTMLVAAFRATLEEVSEADLVVHVRDIAHPDTAAQARDVAAVLSDLGIDLTRPGRVLEVWNKIDLIPADQRRTRLAAAEDVPAEARPPIAISALTGEGVPELLDAVEAIVSRDRGVYRVELAGESLGLLHRLYEFGDVLKRSDAADGGIVAEVRVRPENAAKFRRVFADAEPLH